MIKEITNSIYPLSKNSLNEIESLVELVNYDKGETFIQRNIDGMKKNISYWSGVCKSYLINPEGQMKLQYHSLPKNQCTISVYQIRTSKRNFKSLNFQSTNRHKISNNRCQRI
jgi:hypothetical protein